MSFSKKVRTVLPHQFRAANVSGLALMRFGSFEADVSTDRAVGANDKLGVSLNH